MLSAQGRPAHLSAPRAPSASRSLGRRWGSLPTFLTVPPPRSPGSPAPGSCSGSRVEPFHTCWTLGVSCVWTLLIPFCPAPSLAAQPSFRGRRGDLWSPTAVPRSPTLAHAAGDLSLLAGLELLRAWSSLSPGHPTPPSSCLFSLSLSVCTAGLGSSRGRSRHPSLHHVPSQKRLYIPGGAPGAPRALLEMVSPPAAGKPRTHRPAVCKPRLVEFVRTPGAGGG